MLDLDTFLTQLYVMADDFCKSQPNQGRPNTPGPDAALAPSETITLVIVAQWRRFSSQTDFYRWAEGHLRRAFPALPNQSQFNPQVRQLHKLVCRFVVHLAQTMQADRALYQALDLTAAPVRNCKRRARGWLAGWADLGKSGRLGFFEGFQVLMACTGTGIITGFGFGPATSKEQAMTETFLRARHEQDERLPSAGGAASVYLADKGFEGFDWHAHWRQAYQAKVITPPKRSTSRARWSKALGRQMASLRQVIETVFARLHGDFALERARPHTLAGFGVMLASKAALHNFCIWLNRLLGRAPMAFADLIAW